MDETIPAGSPNILFGTLICTPARAMILHQRLSRIWLASPERSRRVREVKWNKASRDLVDVHEEFVQAFAAEPGIGLRLVSAPIDRWERQGPQARAALYVDFLCALLGERRSYSIIVDEVAALDEQWDELRRRANAFARARELPGRISALRPMHSGGSLLIQLCDLVLGGLAAPEPTGCRARLWTMSQATRSVSCAQGVPKIQEVPMPTMGETDQPTKESRLRR